MAFCCSIRLARSTNFCVTLRRLSSRVGALELGALVAAHAQERGAQRLPELRQHVPQGLRRRPGLLVVEPLHDQEPRQHVAHAQPVPVVRQERHDHVLLLPLDQVHLQVPARLDLDAALAPLHRDVLRALEHRLLLDERRPVPPAHADAPLRQDVVARVPAQRHVRVRLHHEVPQKVRAVLHGHHALEHVGLPRLEHQLVVRAPNRAERLGLRPRHLRQVVLVRLPDARLRPLLVLLLARSDHARDHARDVSPRYFVLSHLVKGNREICRPDQADLNDYACGAGSSRRRPAGSCGTTW